MNAKVIGIGAAGNKAAITLIEKGVMSIDNILLINSTLKDVPDKYKNIAVQLSETDGGCGKEREPAKDMALEAIQNDKLSKLDGLLDPNDDLVIIVNSSEGGTGCGASSIVSKYMKEVVGTNVHMFVFTGFEEDGRGLQNTIEYFQELSPDYVVEAISNKKFLESGNKLKAEKLANEEFAQRVKVLLGKTLVESEQNIDETDLYKIANTSGFMTIEYREIDKIKNVGMFNEIVTDMIDSSKSLDTGEPSAKRIGVILNISERTREFIDYSFSVIKERYGTPYEIFTHVQDEGEKEYIAFIVSGMVIPLEEVKAVYQKYKKASESVNKKKDEFFDTAKQLQGNKEDVMFNMQKQGVSSSIDANKKDFLKGFGKGAKDPQNPPAKTQNSELKTAVVRSDSGFQNTQNKKTKEEFVKDNY